MKGLKPLFLGIFATFAFSWLGLALVPNYQIGHLDPQSDEEGTDVYPMPLSGMAERGRKVYAANGCFYCHSQQVRPDTDSSDIDRKWGDRRSAPRDYIFSRPVMLGNERMGPDLANVGKRAPADDSNTAAPVASPAGSPAAAASPAAAKPAPSTPSVASSPPTAPPGSSQATRQRSQRPEKPPPILPGWPPAPPRWNHRRERAYRHSPDLDPCVHYPA